MNMDLELHAKARKAIGAGLDALGFEVPRRPQPGLEAQRQAVR